MKFDLLKLFTKYYQASTRADTVPHLLVVDYRILAFLLGLVLVSNILTYSFSRSPDTFIDRGQHEHNRLYLLDQAQRYVYDLYSFEQGVRKVSHKLEIPPEWLMAVMHAESKFDAAVKNHKGSGATGLIQWMPATAKDFNTTVQQLGHLNHVQQLEYVYKYLDQKRRAHAKEYETLTDLYLAILYPRAMSEEYCYTMYADPSEAYKLNKGLDQDKDGRVTVQDIDRFLKKIYPTAYIVPKEAAYRNRNGLGRIVTSIFGK
jgi:hypothetical protein